MENQTEKKFSSLTVTVLDYYKHPKHIIYKIFFLFLFRYWCLFIFHSRVFLHNFCHLLLLHRNWMRKKEIFNIFFTLLEKEISIDLFSVIYLLFLRHKFIKTHIFLAKIFLFFWNGAPFLYLERGTQSIKYFVFTVL